MLASGPLALLLVDRWRLAWGVFAVVTAVVTVWVGRVVPAGGRVATDEGGVKPRLRRQGSAPLLAASFVMGMSSVAVWTFGQQIVGTSSRSDWLAPAVWTIVGAAGIAGAFSGRLVDRLGIRAAWTVLMVLLAAGSAGLAAGASRAVTVLTAGAAFGAAYIALTGVLLVWATRIYRSRPSVGVGLAFFMIAAGQAVGAPLIGLSSQVWTLPAVFFGCAVVGLAGACIRGPERERD